jgi:hypothetical protein
VNTSEAYANGRYENKKRITAQVLRERFTGQTKYSSDHCQAVSEAHSKAFTVTSPAGVTYVGKNLKEFCRDFDLNGGTMGQVLLGKARAHKGWTGAYDDAPEELIGIAGLGFPSPVVLF